MNNNEILLQAIKENMDAQLNWNIAYDDINEGKNEGIIKIGIAGYQWIELKFFVINNYSKITFDRLHGMHSVASKAIFIAHSITENIKKELKDNYISYIEMNGNAFIHKHPIYIFISGNKKEQKKIPKSNRAFSKTGLKIIFAYLTSTESLNHPIRIWASMLDIGYTNFHYVNQGLKELKYLLAKDANTMILHNKKDLLERWIHHFEEKLKPDLFIGRFSFSNSADYGRWEKLQFKDTSTQWGGEPAAALLTENLEPQLFTIYTAETKSELVKNYRIVPDEKGNIYVYKNFYRYYPFGHTNMIAHPVLVYADLMITQESRNMIIAKEIYEQYIQY
jgi:hypothetical protein